MDGPVTVEVGQLPVVVAAHVVGGRVGCFGVPVRGVETVRATCHRRQQTRPLQLDLGAAQGGGPDRPDRDRPAPER
jgi:hypothetical protein